MKDVVDKIKRDDLSDFIKERILENKKLFTNEEIRSIKNDKNLVKKIYLLGFFNAKNCYHSDTLFDTPKSRKSGKNRQNRI